MPEQDTVGEDELEAGEGWTIHLKIDVNLLGSQTYGYDIDASLDNAAVIIERALCDEYPGADILVDVVRPGDADASVSIYPSDYFEEEEEDLDQRPDEWQIGELISSVLSSDCSWLVDVPGEADDGETDHDEDDDDWPNSAPNSLTQAVKEQTFLG
ncbi:MAG: hypothetical protein M1358_00595 [Chloroflexi bacterium]|nr:hypothetical protein [Chloroflexota bacterium]